MDVNIVYFATHGSTATEPTSWSAIIIEDGEMESLSGFEPSSLTATLSGLVLFKSFAVQYAHHIRSPKGHCINWRNWIANWQRDGWEHEPDSEFITALRTWNLERYNGSNHHSAIHWTNKCKRWLWKNGTTYPNLCHITTDSATTVDPVESSSKSSDREDSQMTIFSSLVM